MVPCGKCFECCKAYSREWAIRCMREMKDNNNIGCFVTLTYKETDGKLHKKELQDFIKRLRSHLHEECKKQGTLDIRIRYFGCGEYGGKRGRPHYHINIFGWRPDDLVWCWHKNGEDYYCSPTIGKLWPLGFNTVGDINYKTAFYTAKYMAKLDDRYHEVKPFTIMSLKPGIGCLNVTYEDLIREKIYIDDKISPLPRAFVKKLEKSGFNIDMLKLHRRIIADSTSEFIDKDGYMDYTYIDKLHNDNKRILSDLQKVVVIQKKS